MDDRLARQLRIFDRLARVAAQAPYQVHDVLERVAAEFRGAFAFQRALVVRLRLADRTVHAVVQQGVDWPGDEWLRLDSFPFLERALTAGRAVLVRDARAEAAIPSRIIERFGVRSVVAVPLMIEGRCLGFLVGDRTGGHFDLSDDELDILSGLGTVAAVFIEKADQLAALERALDELRGLDEAKSDFISIASHELRTPIAVVHGIAATLHFRGDELRPDQFTELRTTLHEQTLRLRVLAEQLLDLSRLEAGAVAIRRERFSARDCLDSVVQRLAPEREQEVQVAVDPRLELETDRIAFERVVSNLLDNALRYGRPPIQVRVADGGQIRLVVQDSGEGVDPEFVPELFERFTRSESSRKRRTEGAGLGLAIAASFAEAIGGRVSYERCMPTGARFTLELPA